MGDPGGGRHGYAFVGTIPVTEEPEGPRIWSPDKFRVPVEGKWANLALSVVFWDDTLHEVNHTGNRFSLI